MNAGKTHFYGDDCPGGHMQCASRGASHWGAVELVTTPYGQFPLCQGHR